MKDLYSRQEGVYIPSFFCMKIDSLSFDEDMSDRDLSLFVHEYIHFIQNIATLYGLERTNSDFGILINMINWIKGHKDSTIKVPLNETILNELTLNNRNISNLTWGDTNDVRDIDIIKVENSPDFANTIDKYRTVESIVLTFRYKENGKEDICSFGARDVYEGMAYLIEQHITNDYEKSSDIPYNTVFKVAKYIHPELVKDYRNVLVICDKALMSSNPGAEFVEIVMWLADNNYVPNVPRDLYILLDQYWETYDVTERVYWLDNFKRQVETVRENMHQLLQDDYFKDYHEWIDYILDFAIKLRSVQPMFLLDIVNNGNVRNNKYFQAFLEIAGCPLVENIKHEYFFISPKGFDSSCLVYFKVFYQIYDLLLNGNTQCSLMPWCNDCRNIVDVDISCHKCPWKHSEKNGLLCTFAGVWQHWGLNNVTIEHIHH